MVCLIMSLETSDLRPLLKYEKSWLYSYIRL